MEEDMNELHIYKAWIKEVVNGSIVVLDLDLGFNISYELRAQLHDVVPKSNDAAMRWLEDKVDRELKARVHKAKKHFTVELFDDDNVCLNDEMYNAGI